MADLQFLLSIQISKDVGLVVETPASVSTDYIDRIYLCSS